MMKFYAKSALNQEQLKSRIKTLNDGLEIQLLTELVNKLHDYKRVEDVFNLKEFENFPIKVIHAPLLTHFGIADINLESLCTLDQKLFYEICKIADFFGTKNEPTIIVIHSEMSFKEMKLIGILEKIICCLHNILQQFPNIEIAIENVTPFRDWSGKNPNIRMGNNFKFDCVEMAKELRKILQTTRIGTVLDTCHAQISINFLNLVFSQYQECFTDENITMETYFEKNKETIKLIHLSDTISSGYGKGRHGQPFSLDRREELFYLLDLYKKYEYVCPITLEVAETDILQADGYIQTRELIGEYFR